MGLGLGVEGDTSGRRKVMSRQEFERDYEQEGAKGEPPCCDDGGLERKPS